MDDPDDRKARDGRLRGMYYDLFSCTTRAPPYAAKPRLCHPPPGSPEDSWQHCTRLVEAYDADMCKAYREQIDTLMVFAGLFSAVVTAFTIESYQWLRVDSGSRSVELLAQIVTLLAHNQSSSSSLSMVSSYGSDSPPSASTSARINVYWFLSLTVSLSSALVAILCKQWLREYERNEGKTGKARLAVRQLRFDGLLYWRVGEIVDTIPIILQLALALFLLGVIELLHVLNRTVAAPIIVVVTLTLAFYIATTLVPSLQMTFQVLGFDQADYSTRLADWMHCPYKSPQSWLVLRIFHAVLLRIVLASPNYDALTAKFRIPVGLLSWSSYDESWVHIWDACFQWPLHDRLPHETSSSHVSCASWIRALKWTIRTFRDHPVGRWAWHCLVDERGGKGAAIAARPDVVLEMESLLTSTAHGRTWRDLVANGYTGASPPEMKMLAYALAFECGLEVTVELFIRISTARHDPGMLWTNHCIKLILDKYQGLQGGSSKPVDLNGDHAFYLPLYYVAKRRKTVAAAQPGAVDPNAMQTFLLNLIKLHSLSEANLDRREAFIGTICSDVAGSWLFEIERRRLLSASYPGPPIDESTRKKCVRAAMVVLFHSLSNSGHRWPLDAVSNFNRELINGLSSLARTIAFVWPGLYDSPASDWSELAADPDFVSQCRGIGMACGDAATPAWQWHVARFRKLVDYWSQPGCASKTMPGLDLEDGPEPTRSASAPIPETPSLQVHGEPPSEMRLSGASELQPQSAHSSLEFHTAEARLVGQFDSDAQSLGPSVGTSPAIASQPDAATLKESAQAASADGRDSAPGVQITVQQHEVSEGQ